jgi:hypothetical protein
LGAEDILPLLAILAVAIIGKYVGAYVGARLQEVPHWQASSLGLLMNTRGLTELIILNVGLEKGLLSPDRFTLMVIMALVTTVMTGPLLGFTYPQRRVARDIAEAERATLGAEAVDRILVLSRPGADNAVPLELAITMLAAARPAEVVVADFQPQGRLLDLGSGLSGELADMAAAMESQEVLVRRGEELGVPVRVIAHPTADVEADVVELVQVLAPQGLVAWSDDPSLDAVLAVVDCPAAVVAEGTTTFPTGAAVSVAWSADSDGDAAVVIGARLALARHVALQLPADGGRRLGTIRAALEERGVRVTEPATPDPDSGLSAAVIDIAAHGASPAPSIGARSEPDAVPVDFTTVVLGATAEAGAE